MDETLRKFYPSSMTATRTFFLSFLLYVTIALVICACPAFADSGTTNISNAYEQLAKEHGYLTNLLRGRELVRKLSRLTPAELEKFEIDAHRGERVAFVGVGAPPGASNDLLTEDGFYVRVVNQHGRNMRPHSKWWEVMVCGKILQVLPRNKIIVIDVDEKDWVITQAG